MEYWAELGYTICMATIKTSVLISYNMIFGRLRWFRYTLITLATLTMIWFVGVFFSVLFQCTPVDKAWQPTKPGHCIAFKPFLWGNSISNAILDWLILLLPVAPVLTLQMGRVQKTLVLASFSLGSLYVSSPESRHSIFCSSPTLAGPVSQVLCALLKPRRWTRQTFPVSILLPSTPRGYRPIRIP